MYAPDLLRKLAAGSKDKHLKKNFKLGLETLDKLFHLAAVSYHPHNATRCPRRCSIIDVMGSYHFFVTKIAGQGYHKEEARQSLRNQRVYGIGVQSSDVDLRWRFG